MVCCVDDHLCEHCYGRELLAKCRQAGVIGQCWAERICRGDLRAQPAWPERDDKAIRIARRLVATLARDPRLLDALAAACSSGAAAWWQRRPERYRVTTAVGRPTISRETVGGAQFDSDGAR
jgi:hypothetical protein